MNLRLPGDEEDGPNTIQANGRDNGGITPGTPATRAHNRRVNNLGKVPAGPAVSNSHPHKFNSFLPLRNNNRHTWKRLFYAESASLKDTLMTLRKQLTTRPYEGRRRQQRSEQ
eukprot:4728621-Heterocapsa_arctica.AAC.1